MDYPISHRAFTLIELLVVISIIAILAGMLLPAVAAVRDAARAAVCRAQMAQIGLGVLAYTEDWEGRLPISYTNAAPYRSWCDEERVGGYLDGGVVIQGAYTVWSNYPGPWRCPSDRNRLVAGGHVSNTVSYGLSAGFICPVTADLDAGAAIARLRKLAQIVLAADTQEQRWQTAVTAANGCGDQALTSGWGVPAAQRAYNAFARHRGGVNLAFLDGHVQGSATLPAQLLDKTFTYLQADVQ